MATMTQFISNTALTAMMVPVFEEMALNLDVRNNSTTQNDQGYHNFFFLQLNPLYTQSPPSLMIAPILSDFFMRFRE
jgi:hypothetical protein